MKSDDLYKAMGNIDDKIIKDAEAYQAEKREHPHLRAVFYGIGVAALICSFFVLSFVLLKVSGPRTDPATSGEESTVQTETETKQETETGADTDGTPFYAFNAEQTYEKYGIVSFIFDVNMDNFFDGRKYIYAGNFSGEDTTSIHRFEYPDTSTLEFACTDPLCTHNDSSCPFYGANPLAFACYEGKMYFVTSYNEVRCYDPETNKCVKLFGRCQRNNAIFLKYDGNLYLHYNEYQNKTDVNESPATKKFVMITPDGKVTELGQLDWSSLYSDFGLIYKDKYYVDYKREDGRIRVLLRNIKTGETDTAAVIECSRIRETDIYCISMSYMLYGDQLLVRLNYGEKTDIWLIDLKTGEKRLVCTPDSKTYTTKAWCLFSQRCCMWHEPRQSESDPLILHVLFPKTGEEITYDLSKMVYDATGDKIPLDLYIFDMANSAVRLRKTIGEWARVIYEIDLENGNVRKITE